MGRQRPGWDNVFSAIQCGYGQHRRHIVMSSVMRMATYKVFDSTLNNENDQMKLKQGLISLYNKKELSEGKTPTVFQSPEQLESAITSMFHNNKANIFLGGGKFNSAIGGLAHQAEKIEEQTIGALKTAGSRDDVVKLAEGWIEQMGKASVFGNTNQRDFIVGVFKDMIDMLTSEPSDKIQLANDIVGVIRDFYDTMANDVSEASNTNLKHFQNDTMMQMQIEFMKLCAAPNVDGLLRLTEGFINAEVYGLQMLDIDEAQLYSGNQTEISKLQKAI